MPEVERRCRCATSDGLVDMCFAADWMPVGCTCVEPAADPADSGDSDASVSDANDASADAAPPADGGASWTAGGMRVNNEPADAARYLFDDTQLRTYNILIAQADLDAIDAKPSDETWVPARLEFEGTVYGPYMVRYKGAAGSFRYPCTSAEFDDPKTGKCSIKLGFNEIEPEGRFFGLKKLNLHSLNADPSLMRDRLSYALFREQGVAAPRAVHARVLINGRLEGLFAAVEQIDGRFTRARFGDGGEGNLYKEVWPVYSDPSEYLFSLETNEDEDPSVERMLEWNRALETGSGALEAFVDPEYVARYMAVDRVIVNDDGLFHFYCDEAGTGAWNHNYYFYEGERRFWPIPWDMDFAFDGSPWVRLTPAWSEEASCTCAGTEYGKQMPASCDPVVQQFMQLQPEYERQVELFLAGPFSAERVDAKLAAWTEQIRATVIEAATVYGGPSEADFADGLDELKRTIATTRKERGLSF
jgi:spore coat protein H